MKNENVISEMINQVREIEQNMFTNMEHATSMNMLVNSNDLAKSKDLELSGKIDRLNRHIEDINKLTADLLNDLTRRHN